MPGADLYGGMREIAGFAIDRPGREPRAMGVSQLKFASSSSVTRSMAVL
ncbi:hypothetical protein [Mangrovicoccus ximenensis]|nr:hypothetical protein [Mangrovicoccus ximenensis]